VGALERDEFSRAAWRVMVAEPVEAERLLFVDEMGTNTSSCLPCTLGRPKASESMLVCASQPGSQHYRASSSMGVEGMGPSLTVEGSTTSVLFEAYVERVLAPTLRRGQVVVMDNLSAHKGERIRELIEERGCELVYLPSYSPLDLDPIEEAFSKIKGLVRKAEARTKEALIEAIGSALCAVTSGDARSFFEHGGYRTSVQSLW
jgi:transposase